MYRIDQHRVSHSEEKIIHNAVNIKPLPDDDLSWISLPFYPFVVNIDGWRNFSLFCPFRIFYNCNSSHIEKERPGGSPYISYISNGNHFEVYIRIQYVIHSWNIPHLVVFTGTGVV